MVKLPGQTCGTSSSGSIRPDNDAASSVAADARIMHQVQPKSTATKAGATTARSPSWPIRRVGTMLSTSFNAGVSLETIRRRLGHANAQTVPRYADQQTPRPTRRSALGAAGRPPGAQPVDLPRIRTVSLRKRAVAVGCRRPGTPGPARPAAGGAPPAGPGSTEAVVRGWTRRVRASSSTSAAMRSMTACTRARPTVTTARSGQSADGAG
jgi:hypothetical protein